MPNLRRYPNCPSNYWRWTLQVPLLWYEPTSSFEDLEEELPEVHKWLVDVVGPEGKEWGCAVTFPLDTPVRSLRFLIFFRSEQHKLMFKLAWGGG